MRKWYAFLLAIAVTAACSSRPGGSGLVPPAPGLDGVRTPDTVAHAACAMATGLKSPVAGTIAVGNAFGQLMATKTGTRYAFPNVDFTYAANKNVYAATAGVATYYAKMGSFGKTLIVKSGSGVQTQYSGLLRIKLTLSKKNTAPVKAGQAMAVSAGPLLHFAYAPKGQIGSASMHANPCGTGNAAANGSISVMPTNVAVYARFHTMSVDGVPLPPGQFPSGNPDVATPQTIGSTNVAKTATVNATVYERSVIYNQSYYVVLCGNAAFATGPARYAGPFQYPGSSSTVVLASPAIPPVVFFRDAGTQGGSLIAPLPAPYAFACPAPGPANLYNNDAPIFYQVGQTQWLYYWCNLTPDTVSFTSNNPSVATESPSPVTVYSTAQPNWPPPSDIANITATGIGATTIAVSDQQCSGSDTPISVTVAPTPVAAGVPTPIPN